MLWFWVTVVSEAPRGKPNGVEVRVVITLVHPCRVKSFRKAVSAVMDDLELCGSIIDNSTLIIINKLA